VRRILLVALAALWLGGCASNPITTVIGQIATGTLPNPISTTNVYQVKNVYAIAAESTISYRGYCFGRTYAVLMADPIAKNICANRRPVWRKIVSYKNTAYAAVVKADNFVKNNPTLDASAVISQATAAISALQSVTPAVPKS
jgi:hypothetical protein